MQQVIKLLIISFCMTFLEKEKQFTVIVKLAGTPLQVTGFETVLPEALDALPCSGADFTPYVVAVLGSTAGARYGSHG